MERQGDEIHVNTTEASGGVTNHGVRYVLAFGLALAIAFLSVIWITGSYLSGNPGDKPVRLEGVAAETG